MSKLITTITYGQKYRVKIDVIHTTLSLEQIQILSGLVFSKYHSHEYYHPNSTIKYVLEGYTLTDEHNQEQFAWKGDVVTYTWLDDDVDPDTENECVDTIACEYQVGYIDGYTILRCDSESTTITFKDGMLESIADEPAVEVEYSNGFTVRMWFHQNKCYRPVNPDLPSSIAYDWYSHHNSNGKLHRDVKLGPATYLIEDGVLQKGENMYVLNGVECDEDGDVPEYVKRLFPGIPDYDVPEVTGEHGNVAEQVPLTPFEPEGYGARFVPLPAEDSSERLEGIKRC